MTNEEIKTEREKLHEQIEKATERIKELQIICKHENTFEGNYSWRIGNIQKAEICSDCAKLIKYI